MIHSNESAKSRKCVSNIQLMTNGHFQVIFSARCPFELSGTADLISLYIFSDIHHCLYAMRESKKKTYHSERTEQIQSSFTNEVNQLFVLFSFFVNLLAHWMSCKRFLSLLLLLLHEQTIGRPFLSVRPSIPIGHMFFLMLFRCR